ncbi:MAG: hypothetical protein OXI59_14825 [Gemmatimonadota bacterium]|nr:hypothetical protein [Gemmatimonadota bacterium]
MYGHFVASIPTTKEHFRVPSVKSQDRTHYLFCELPHPITTQPAPDIRQTAQRHHSQDVFNPGLSKPLDYSLELVSHFDHQTILNRSRSKIDDFYAASSARIHIEADFVAIRKRHPYGPPVSKNAQHTPPAPWQWSTNATVDETIVFTLLAVAGHYRVARRLSDLVDILAEDGDNLSLGSITMLANFVLTHKPRYPGPGIFSDDNGFVSIQWRIPTHGLTDETNTKGILHLKFISPNQISYFGTAGNIRLDDETTPDRLIEKIRPLTKRLDW